MVMDAVDLGGAARPRRHRDRQRQVERLVLQQHARQRGLSRARGRGQDQDHAAAAERHRFRSFDVLHLLAQLLDLRAQFKPLARSGETSLDLAHKRVGLAAEFLGEEIEPAADRPALASAARARRRHARSAGRVPRGCRLWRRAGSPPDAAGSRRNRAPLPSRAATLAASRARIASGWRAGFSSAARVSAAISSSRSREHRGERRAFRAARSDQRGERLVEGREDAGGGGGDRRLVVARLDDFDDAADREDAVERRRRKPEFFRRGSAPRRGSSASSGRSIPRVAGDALALGVDRGETGPARQRLPQPRARLGFDALEGGRQRSRRSSPLALTHLEFDGPAPSAARAGSAGETGHAGKGHRGVRGGPIRHARP